MKTAALYARYSSDLQKERSIDDQFALCEKYAKQHGYKVVDRFSDRAKSAATLFEREGIAAVRAAAKRKEFDAVIFENLDRVSRDQEDLAGLFKRLTHYGVAMIATNEGAVTEVHVGVRGIVGSLFLKDLAGKVKRGQSGMISEGKVPGVVTYGYDRVWDEAARIYRPGERVINEEQASVIRRIFREYSQGVSPREIAAGLTRDGIPTPSGGKVWNNQTFVGGRHQRGMVSNPIYIGELFWNVRRTVLDPDTGKKLKRANPESEITMVKVPELRIIDQALWDAAQAVRSQRAVAKFGVTGKVSRRPVLPRGTHLLSGLLRCEKCNGPMRIAQKSRDGSPRVACAAAHQHGTCDHSKSYDTGALERVVISGFRDNLLDPEPINKAAKKFHEEYQGASKRTSAERLDVEKRLARVTLQIERLVKAIMDSDDPVEVLSKQLRDKEAERVGLSERLRLLKSDNVVSLHPNVVEEYKANVARLHDALSAGEPGAEHKVAFRNLIDSIVIHETGKRMPYEISVYGRLAAMMGVNLFPNMRTIAQIVAEEGILDSSDSANQEKSVSS